MIDAIQSAIDTIEREHAVRVLFAAESGSRAWGFASPDSDYDLRFIYAPRIDWYLQVGEPRDVLEAMLPGDLDLSGWELRKTLRLFARCNLALNEWLGSPIVYRQDEAFASALRELVPRYFRVTQGLFHYLGMARGTYAEHLGADAVRIKKMFYFLRPILACRWIEHDRSQPPTEFDRLLAAPWVAADERAMIDELMATKRVAREAELYRVDAHWRRWMLAQQAHVEQLAPRLAEPGERDLAPLDRLLRHFVAGERTRP